LTIENQQVIMGVWHDESLDFIRELGRRITTCTGDPRKTAFLLQRISVAIQRGNSIAFTGSLPEGFADGDAD